MSQELKDDTQKLSLKINFEKITIMANLITGQLLSAESTEVHIVQNCMPLHI